MSMDIQFKWNKSEDAILREALKRPQVLLFMANEWQKLYDPFVPMRTGLLAHDATRVYVEDDMGIIHHSASYSRRVYYGTTFNFSKEKHPLASAMWDEEAKSAGKREELVRSVQAYVKGTKI